MSGLETAGPGLTLPGGGLPGAVPATRATKRALVRYTLLSWAMAMVRVSSRLRRELDTPQHTKHKG